MCELLLLLFPVVILILIFQKEKRYRVHQDQRPEKNRRKLMAGVKTIVHKVQVEGMMCQKSCGILSQTL